MGGSQFITAARQVDAAERSSQSIRLRDACEADRAEKERKYMLEQERSLVRQQQAEYEESLQKDQEKDRLCTEKERLRSSKHSDVQVVCENTDSMTCIGVAGTTKEDKEYVRAMRLKRFQNDYP